MQSTRVFRFRLAVILALACLTAVGTSLAQPFIQSDENGDLDARWSWALAESRDAGADSGFWVAYSFTRMMCENCWSGTYFDSDWDSLPSIAEQLSGMRIDDDFRSVKSAARRSLEKLEGDGRIVPKRIAVLARFGPNDRLPSKIAVSNMSMAFDFRKRPVFWLGAADDAESIALLQSIYNSDADSEARKSALYTIGMHDAPGLAVPFLSGVLSGDAEVEYRKAAAYGLGSQDNAQALRVLRSTALTDRESEVAKACVYAMGNLELADATEALQDIVVRTGLSMEVRKAALYSLGNRDEAAALVTLRSVALGDHPQELQKAATYAIGNLDVDGTVDALASILRTAPRTEVQKAALYAIGNQDTPEASRFLLETALSDRNTELSKAAVYALGNTLEDNDIDPLLQVLKESRNTEVRKAAVYAVSNQDDEAALVALQYVLRHDDSAEVRKAAVYALGNIDSDEARAVLIALIGDIGK